MKSDEEIAVDIKKNVGVDSVTITRRVLRLEGDRLYRISDFDESDGLMPIARDLDKMILRLRKLSADFKEAAEVTARLRGKNLID